LVTTPFISLLDRGNDIGIAVGLIAWALWAWRSERWVLCGAFLAAAIALKAYPAALLVVPLALRRYRFTALVAGSGQRAAHRGVDESRTGVEDDRCPARIARIGRGCDMTC